MSFDWKARLLDLGLRVEHRWDGLRRSAKGRLGWLDPVTIVPFRGYGDDRRLRVKGRVLEGEALAKWEPGAATWRNLVHMLHRFESDEVPGACIRASAGGLAAEVISDEEGYFEVLFDGIDGPGAAPGTDARWREVNLELLQPLPLVQTGPVRATAHVLVPPPAAEFGVISDIDDTIIKTGATSLLRNLRTTFFSSVERRTPFYGVRAFYRALECGTRGQPVNPIFYVSSSPWNLYDLLERFMALNGIPVGPMFLRDLGWDHTKFIKSRHEDHKLEAIERLFGFYPDMRFILIGDSGQHDPAIYRKVVQRHPDRVLAVYIRDLSGDPMGHPQTRALLGEVRAAGVQASLSADLLEAAGNAATHGWITADAVREVHAEVKRVQLTSMLR